jgi:hypothetical protein
MLVLIALLSVAAVRQAAPGNGPAWMRIGAGTTLYLGALLAVAQRLKPLPETFYEWWVEGILFVPAIAYSCAR